MKKNKQGPRILLMDIETSPLEVYTWGLFDQNIGLNQVKEHTYILSWSAKWLGESKIFYMDQKNSKDFKNDKKILEGMHKLLSEADIVIGHNSKRFDCRKLNYRFIVNNMLPPSPYRQIDTLTIAKRYFAFDSNKLEHLAKILNVKHKKLTNREFNGFELWKECLDHNPRAWSEMKKYNVLDTLTLESIYNVLKVWDPSINFEVYNDNIEIKCQCGSNKLQKRGFNYSNTGRYQRFQCLDCGKWTSSKQNLLSKEKKKSLLK